MMLQTDAPLTSDHLKPLTITAHLMNGFASYDPWSPAIDGILAYWMLRQRMGEAAFTASAIHSDTMEPVTGLPLGIERDGDWWWYQCSSPRYDSLGEHVSHFHRRFDQALAEQYLTPPHRKVSVKAGPFKQYRLILRTIICATVTWHAIGDPQPIRRLLDSCTHIGTKTGQGNGQVRYWSVAADGDAALARLWRPLPEAFAVRHNQTGPLMTWGLRPPGRLPVNQCSCIMPT